MIIGEDLIEWNFIYTYIKNKIGVELSYYKAEQLHRKILSFMKVKNLSQTFHLISYLDHSQKHLDNFLDHITIAHSKMFVNIEKWKDLELHILPQIYKKEKNINCWNPGCNNGGEAYSLAMILENNFPGNHNIICTDIDQKTLNEAEKGIFNFSDIKGVPHHYRHKFLQEAEEKWIINPMLKRFIKFEKKNLFEPISETGFDLIICRNVAINFISEIQSHLYQKFYKFLKPGGFLFLGALEKIPSHNQFQFENPLPLFYQKSDHSKIVSSKAA